MPYSHIPFYALNVFIHSAVYALFVLIPFRSKLRYSIHKTCGLMILWIFFILIFDLLCFERDSLFTNLNAYGSLIVMLITILFMIIAIKGHTLELVFVLFVIFSFQSNTIQIANLLYAVMPFSPIISWFSDFNYLIYTLIVLIITFPFMWYLFAKLFKKVIDTKIDFLQWKYLFLLPLLYLVYSTANYFEFLDLSCVKLTSICLLILLNSFAYFSFVAVLNMLLKTYENYNFNAQVSLMSKQLVMQRSEYEKLTEQIEKSARQRHDWRHHLLLIRKYTKERDLAGLEEYLNNYFSDLDDDDDAPLCENHAVDILLRHYLSYAKSEGVEVSVKANIPSDIAISDNHLCIIFGNLVENAVESCHKQEGKNRFISIKAQPFGEQLAIMIQNSYNGQIFKDNDEFISSKHQGCGIGISSARSIAEESGGSFKVSYTENIFTVHLLLGNGTTSCEAPQSCSLSGTFWEK